MYCDPTNIHGNSLTVFLGTLFLHMYKASCQKDALEAQYKTTVHSRSHHTFITMCMAKKSFIVTAKSLSPSSLIQAFLVV